MTEPRPLVCVFLKLPPSDRTFSRIYEIALNEFIPQMTRLHHAFEAAQAKHPSSEAKKIWWEARKAAAENVRELQDVSFANYNAASAFLHFLNALHKEESASETYKDFQAVVRGAEQQAVVAQKAMVQLREDLRIAVSRITAIMSGDNKDISSFIAESSQSILEIATAVEECGALLKEFRDEFKEVRLQSFDEKDTTPSDEEFQMVQEKWQTFYETADRLKTGWIAIKNEVRGFLEGDEPPLTPLNNPASPTIPLNPPKSHRVPFWRKFSRRISSCFTSQTVS